MKLISLVLVLLSHISMAQQDTIFKYLNARQTDEGVLISFTIKGGITCSGVSVQRSDTTSGFNTLYEFSGVCGSPTSDESYTYLDKYPAGNRINRYRLELGSLGIFSPLVEVHFLDFSKNGYVTGPNPCRELCSIWFSNSAEAEHEMKLFNSQGELTRLLKTSGNRFDIDALNLGPGVYVFTIQRDKETKNTGRLLIL